MPFFNSEAIVSTSLVSFLSGAPALHIDEVASAADLHKDDLQLRLSFGSDGQPAEPGGQRLIDLDFKAQFANVEVLGLVLIKHINGCV